MRFLVFVFFMLFSSFSFAFNISVTDYYDSTFGDYIPQLSESLSYSNGCFFVVSDLGNVSNGDTISLKVTFPDGEQETYSENSSFDGDAIYYKKVDFRGVGDYKAELTCNGETKSVSFTVTPDSSEDPFEPNNYKNNIFYLERGTVLSSIASRNDCDYYVLKIDNPLTVTLSLESEADLYLGVMKGDTVLGESDGEFEGNEMITLSLDKGTYTVKVFSPVKEKGDYSLTLNGNFPVYLPLTGFNKGFEKNVVVSNLSDGEGDAEFHWYDSEGNEVLNGTIHFLPYGTKHFDGGDYAYLKVFSSDIKVNASVYGKNGDGNEAIAYEAKMLDIGNTIVSHIATQTNLYETVAYFSSNGNGTFLDYQGNVLADNFPENASFLVNFNDYFNNDITTPWGVAQSDADFTGVEMFRLITGDYFQATALTLTPQLARVFYLPHIDVRYFWWTGISIVNPNNSEATVKLFALDAGGNSIAESDINIEPQGKSVGIVTDYFEGGLPEDAASMKVVSDVPVQALYLFGTKREDNITEDIFGGLNSSAIYSKELYFQVMPSSDTEWTGIGIFNPNNEEVSVTLKGVNSNGEVIEEKNITLQGLQKFVSLKKDIFDNENVSQIVAISEKPLAGFYLFGDKDHTYLYGLEALR